MKKKYIIIPVIVALIAAISAGIFFLSKGKKIEATNYNLLFISLDTLRADHVGIYGSEDADTPILDSLARKGVMFKNCYTPVPLTLPAHCTMFTGKYPISLNVRGNGIYALDGKEKTLAEIMKESGYSTYGVISSFVLLAKFGLNQGFDVYDDSLNSHKMYNNYESEIDAPEVYQKFNQWFDKNHDSRFFAWVHLYDPHKPYKAPPEFRKKFNNSQIGRYKAEISYTDHYVGKFIDKLKEKNVLKNTLVVIVGDHGEAFGEHEEHEHGIFCYEEVLKVPLIFYNPDLFSGGLCVENRVNLIDIMPTLLDLFKLKIPAGTQGLSFYNLLRGKKEETPRTFYFESMHGKDEMNWAPLTGIIDGKYKYISLPEPELYDLENDIKEKENLFWKRNREAKDLDKKLLQLVTEYSKAVVDTRRDLTDEDKKHLQTLGYVSSFS
ncbi:MAG: sulfatase-like hydrolase/transferase, partial [bacterium]|nr:sulfatase-like hydrolase/transferase [bacterium]